MPKEDIRHRTSLILNLITGEEEGNIQFPASARLRADLNLDESHMQHLVQSLDCAFDEHHFPWDELLGDGSRDFSVGELVDFLYGHIYDEV